MSVVPIVMITDENYVMPTCVAITSIIYNKNTDSKYDFFILMPECSHESKKKVLETVFHRSDCTVKIIDANIEKFRSINQISHISIAGLLKFDVCDLIPQYDKLLFLDSDIIVRSDLSNLFNTCLYEKYIAGVKELDNISKHIGNINSGIMVLNAKRIREDALSKKMYDVRISLGDRGSMDQQTINIVTNRDYIYLPVKYNCIIDMLIGNQKKREYTIRDVNNLYNTNYKSKKQLVMNAEIVHFATGAKPWIYTYTKGAKEWYYYYLQSPYKNEKIIFDRRTVYRIKKISKMLSDGNIKGLLHLVKERNLRKKKKIYEWE